MMSLIKIEWYKLRGLVSFWILTGLFFLLLPTFFYYVGSREVKIFSINFEEIFYFPGVWYYVSYIGHWFNLILGLTVIILVSIEFSNKTLRQNIIDGLSRADLLVGKIILSLIICIICTVYVFLVGLWFGLSYSEGEQAGMIIDKIYYVGVYFVQAMGYMTLALLIALTVRKVGLSIILFLFAIPIEFIIQIPVPEKMEKFFPMEVIANLTPNPLIGLYEERLEDPMVNFSPELLEEKRAVVEAARIEHMTDNLPVAIFYVILFIGLSGVILHKRSV